VTKVQKTLKEILAVVSSIKNLEIGSRKHKNLSSCLECVKITMFIKNLQTHLSPQSHLTDAGHESPDF
jgi:hypothetical protein